MIIFYLICSFPQDRNYNFSSVDSNNSSRMELDVKNTYKPLERAFSVSNSLLVGAGPVNVSPRVLHALTLPLIYPTCDEMFKIMDDMQEMMKYAFQTKNTLTFAAQASGNGGLETIITNLVDPYGTIIIAVGGVWGDRAVEMAKRYNVKVVRLTTKPGDVFTLEELTQAIAEYSPTLLFITHGESSAGTNQPLEGLGEICHKYDCLFAVDAVASLGGVPLFVDRWKIDACVGATQKGLGAPPGLALLTFSPLASKRMDEKKHPPPYNFDVKGLSGSWNCSSGPRRYHYTYNPNMLYALREALAELSEEGLENRWDRHERNCIRFRDGLEKLNLKLFVPNPENRLNTVTSILLPEGIQWTMLLDYLSQTYKVEIGFGIGPTAHKAIRIGFMGYNSRPEVVDYVLEVLQDGLKYCEKNAGIKATPRNLAILETK